jgi:hypothetical protein
VFMIINLEPNILFFFSLLLGFISLNVSECFFFVYLPPRNEAPLRMARIRQKTFLRSEKDFCFYFGFKLFYLFAHRPGARGE